MKKYRVMFRPSERANDEFPRTQEVEADGWRVDAGVVCLYRRRGKKEVRVLDVPKNLIMRIQEIYKE